MNFGDWIRLQLLGDNSSDLVGQYGEDLTARSLKWSKLFGYSGLMLRNVYIPAGIGETTEIDLIYITQKGLFVIESKNFSGWIFGREKDQYWTQSMPDKSKFRFFNPIWQNRGHIKWLKAFLKDDAIPCFSLIVFSERCELKQLQFYDEHCKVIHRGDLFLTVRSMWKRLPDVLDEKQKKSIYDTLSILQNADEAMKQAHVERIQSQYSANRRTESSPAEMQPEEIQSAPEEPAQNHAEGTDKKCPRCGAVLILRTSKKGETAGKQFYGCSAFPKCRYMSDTDETESEPVPDETTAPVQEQPPVTEPEPEPAKQEDTERKCPLCGAALVLRTVKKGDHAGKQFYGCSAFPKCRYMSGSDETESEPVPDETSAPVQEQPPVKEPEPEPVKQEDTERKCPRCGAVLVLRTAKKGDNAGKQFYGCSAFPKCRYMTQSGETE